MRFSYTEFELKVLTNFSTINSNIVIDSDKFVTVNGPDGSLVGVYDLEKDHGHDSYGVFDLNLYLQLIKQFKNHELEAAPNYISIYSDSGDQVKFNLTPTELIKTVPIEKLEKNFKELEKNLRFRFTGENLVTLNKIFAILKPEKVFFQNMEGGLKLIAADTTIEESVNPFVTKISEEYIELNEIGYRLLR